MPTKWNSGEILDIEDLTPNVKQFRLRTDGPIDYRPGQFITIDLPISDKRTRRWRSYSIASAPSDGSDVLELCIVRVPDGLGTTFFWNEVKVGTQLKFKDPAGTFVLPKDLDKDIVMLCTGTGIAPFRSMIREVVKQQYKFKSIHLVFGCRSQEYLLYHDELQEYARSFPNFHLDIALSRENSEGFHHGHIHPIYMERYQGIESPPLFMICGWTTMIDEAIANLMTKLKLGRDHISYELYG